MDCWQADIEEIATTPNRRLVQLPHALVDLVRELDQDKIRYPDEELGKVDLAPVAAPPEGRRLES